MKTAAGFPCIRALGDSLAAHAELKRTQGAVRVAPEPGSARPFVSLVDADPEFGDVIQATERALAAGVRLPLLELPAGLWKGPDPAAGPVGSLVLRGLVMRTLHRYGRSNIEVYGPGDLIGHAAPKDGTATWRVVQETALVVLDEHFEIAARRWPALWRVTLDRWSQRAERISAHVSALQLSRVDERVEAIMWQLAERFGKVTRDGVVLQIRLTHQMLGFLTAAKRPTVSVALGELAAQKRVVRLEDGSWLLRRPGFGQEDVGMERRRRDR